MCPKFITIKPPGSTVYCMTCLTAWAFSAPHKFSVSPKAVGRKLSKRYITAMKKLMIILLFATSGTLASDFLPARPMPSAPLSKDTSVSRIALGSCFTPYQTDEIFAVIAREEPDLFLFIGDNVYAEDESDDPELKSLRHAYSTLADAPNFADLRANTPLLTAWDDHDYGKNDGNASFAAKAFSEKLFEHVWALPEDDERRQRPGTYYARTFGPEGRTVQFIVLDTRFFSTPLTPHPDQEVGRYTRSQDPDQDLLGDAQWQWLASELEKPADLRVLVSSLQVIADGHYWESWAMMPLARQSLYTLLAASNNLLIVSGDRHSAAFYHRTDVTPYPLYEMTSSSLNLPLSGWVENPQDEAGPYRLSKPYYEVNYGMIEIDWDNGTVSLTLRDDSSQVIEEQIVNLDELK